MNDWNTHEMCALLLCASGQNNHIDTSSGRTDTLLGGTDDFNIAIFASFRYFDGCFRFTFDAFPRGAFATDDDAVECAVHEINKS